MSSTIERSPALRPRRILLPTDFSEESKQVIPYAVSLARRFGARISFVYVVPTALPPELRHTGTTLKEEQLLGETSSVLARFCEKEAPPDLMMDRWVLSGCPYDKICEAAKALEADLIITATHGHTGLKHFMVGSTAERVVRFAPCPVLTVRAQFIQIRFPETISLRFRKIVVPYDFSEVSRKALPYAASFAREFGAGIRLLHVIEPSSSWQFDRARCEAMETQLKETVQARLEPLLQGCPVAATAQVRIGTAFQEIVQEAAEENADIIILSTRGRTGLEHAFLGSTAERVVRFAACPVLAVRETRHGFISAKASEEPLHEFKLNERPIANHGSV